MLLACREVENEGLKKVGSTTNQIIKSIYIAASLATVIVYLAAIFGVF